MLRAIATTIAGTFAFGGVTDRRTYWTYFFFYVAGGVCVSLMADAQPSGSTGKAYFTVFAALFFVPIPAATVRRLHDVGRNGAWAWLLLLSFVGVLLLLPFTVRRSAGLTHSWPSGSLHRIAIAVPVLILVFVLSRLFWEPFFVPSGSMKPTLLAGDYFAVGLRAHPIIRGDVVVVRHPISDIAFIARVIGTGGDTVEMRAGHVVLGEAGKEPSALSQQPQGHYTEVFLPQGPSGALPRCRERSPQRGEPCNKDLLVETLPNGRAYSVLSIRLDMAADTTSSFTVPDGHLFLLGDNRDNASDSRFSLDRGGLGFVPEANVVGQVNRVVFSASGRFLWNVILWRWDRIWKRIE